jgi:hypothetical protein
MYQNPYYMPVANPYQVSPYVAAMQQLYNTQSQPTQQVQQPQAQQQSQQQITTQPPIMQPQAIIGSKIMPVTNKEEATVAPVDLVQGTPSFFYNKSNGEIYLKQFDVPTGTAIFKVYSETVQPEEVKQEEVKQADYSREFQYISEGIDNLHRMIANLQNQRQYPVNIEKVESEVIDVQPEPIEEKTYKTKKRGQ